MMQCMPADAGNLGTPAVRGLAVGRIYTILFMKVAGEKDLCKTQQCATVLAFVQDHETQHMLTLLQLCVQDSTMHCIPDEAGALGVSAELRLAVKAGRGPEGDCWRWKRPFREAARGAVLLDRLRGLMSPPCGFSPAMSAVPRCSLSC